MQLKAQLIYTVAMSQPTISDHLLHGSWWKQLGDNEYIVRHFNDAFRGEHKVKMSDLTVYDRRLELLLPFLVKHENLAHRDGTLSNAYVYWTLKHLDGVSIPSFDVGNKTHYVELVTSFSGPAEDTVHKTIFMSHTVTTTVVLGSSDYGFKDDLVLHVESLGQQDVLLPKDWLDKNYQGWANRYHTGKAFGLNSWGLGSFVFDEIQTAPSVSMTDLSF